MRSLKVKEVHKREREICRCLFLFFFFSRLSFDVAVVYRVKPKAQRREGREGNTVAAHLCPCSVNEKERIRAFAARA